MSYSIIHTEFISRRYDLLILDVRYRVHNNARPSHRVIQFVDCSIKFSVGWRGQGTASFVGSVLFSNVSGPTLRRINSLKASSVDKFLENYRNIMHMRKGFGTLLALIR